MDQNRAEQFRAKFATAAIALNCLEKEGDLISVKFRDNGGTQMAYESLLHMLPRQFKVENVGNEGYPGLRGRGWKVSGPGGQVALVVEHETGMEIICLAVSIVGTLSFLIGKNLPELLMMIWKRASRGGHGALETRRFDERGELQEEEHPCFPDDPRSSRRDDFMIHEMASRLHDVEKRVDGLEAKLSALSSNAKPKRKTVRRRPKQGPG